MNGSDIHWLRDLLIVIGGINLFVAIWAFASWFNGPIEPKRTEREKFLADHARRAMKRAA